MYEFLLPDVGEGISEALLIQWSVKVGDVIEEDQEVATISTDKVDVELPSPRAGKIAELCWNAGDTVPVGSIFLRLSEEAKGPEKAAATKPEKSKTTQQKATPVAVEKQTSPSKMQIIAAPSTRKRAHELNVNLKDVTGSGQDGRILRRDVETSSRGEHPSASTDPLPATVSGVRAAMSERMAYSVRTLAHSTMNFEVPADGLLALQDRLNPGARAEGLKLSLTAILAKCVSVALTHHPRFNATVDEFPVRLLLHEQVNLGVALASERGLVVPVLRNLQNKTLFSLARDLSNIVERARNDQMQSVDYTGGTFTLSNTGNLEKASFLSTRPVINAPQSAILWVSRIKDRPRVVDDRVEAWPMINCSLSFDHRHIDGADSIAFINELSDLFQVPEQALAAG